MHPESGTLKVYFFVSCFSAMSLNRTKLKSGTRKLKAYEKIMWMIKLGAIYLIEQKSSLLVHPECTLGYTSYGAINGDCFQANPLQGTKLKYMAWP